MTTGAEDTEQPDPNGRSAALVVCLLTIGLTLFDISKANVALPSIKRSLEASDIELTLVISGFALALAMTLVPSGRLGDAGRHRTVMLAALSVFTAASAASALAPSAELLVVFRLVEGAAAGAQLPVAIGLIQQLYRGAERGRAFGLVGATLGIATAAGQPIGGLILALGADDTGWRLLFAANVPLGLFSIWLAARYATRSIAEQRVHLDLGGTAILAVGVLALLAPSATGTFSIRSLLTWGCLLVASAAFAAFLVWERRTSRRGRAPLVDLELFRLGSFRRSVVVGSAYYTAIGALFLLSVLYVQFGLGYGAGIAGLTTLPFALSHSGGSALAGRVGAAHHRRVVVAGLLLVGIGSGGSILAMNLTAEDRHLAWLCVLMGVAGFGGGAVAALNQVVLLSQVPVGMGSTAASIGQLGQRTGNAMGITTGLSLFLGGAAGPVTPLTGYTVGSCAGLLALFVALTVGMRALRLD